MKDPEEIKSLVAGDYDGELDVSLSTAKRPSPRVQSALFKARASLAQKETLAFMLVKFWTVLAKVFAPFFALAVKRHAHSMASQSHVSRSRNQLNQKTHNSNPQEPS